MKNARNLHRIGALLSLCLLPLWLTAQLVMRVAGLPPSTPAGAELYVAGTMNGWKPGLAEYRLKRDDQKNHFIELSLQPGVVEFKFTRGGWETVEAGAGGGFLPNRRIDYRGGLQTESVIIQAWEDLDKGGNARSTAASNVRILANDFNIPQLNRQRRIWIYLPPDYEQRTDRRYPVLYMHDAQNLFDTYTSFSGEWQVDETLNRLFNAGDGGAIVVGIDNGGANRIKEYSPWVNPNYGGGEGAAYVDFIAQTLKPYVDRNYRTLSDRENTGIAGSSMGGLISLYAVVEKQDIFGKAAVLSPSLWFSTEAFAHILRQGSRQSVKLYLMAGRAEGASVVNDLYALENTLKMNGFDAQRQFLVTHPDGQHSEWYWAREFGDVYRWLYSNWTESDRPDSHPLPSLRFSYGSRLLRISTGIGADAGEVNLKLTKPGGEAVTHFRNISNGRVRLPATLAGGTYFAYLYIGNQLLAAQRVELPGERGKAGGVERMGIGGND